MQLASLVVVAGILLTGGGSRRMGFDKALLEVGGLRNAARLAGALREVASPLVEVGPGRSGLPAVTERPVGAGPLVAVAAGAQALARSRYWGPALLLACDLPFVGAEALAVLAGWPGEESVVPVVDGTPQPLCARWSAADLFAAGELATAGERSMKVLLARPGVRLLRELDWPGGLAAHVFADVDTPGDLRRLGLVRGPNGS